jgi:amidase
VKERDPNALIEPLYLSSITALGRAIQQKKYSSEELVKVFMARIDEVNPGINAIVAIAGEEALAAARAADTALHRGESTGPLHGIPFTLKDSIDTAGLVSAAGTAGRAGFVPGKDAVVAARLKAAGAVLLGKTNTPELTLGYDTDNLVYGRTCNPYHTAKSAGGSSGGAAAAIAAGATAFDIGSDTGGSIRFPAHCCGIAGLKPTSGRVPRTGHAIPFGGIIDSFTQLGPMARYVDDLVVPLSIIQGQDWQDPSVVPMPLGDTRDVTLSSLRVSFHTDNGIEKTSREVADTVRRAARTLENFCAVVDEIRPGCLTQSEDIFNGLFNADGGAVYRGILYGAGTKVLSQKWIKRMAPETMENYVQLIADWDDYRVKMNAFMQSYDVIIAPVFPSTAPEPDQIEGTSRLFSYVRAYNLTGWPCVVVRGGTSASGLPIGIQIIARPWREDVALAVAKRLETVLTGYQPPPDSLSSALPVSLQEHDRNDVTSPASVTKVYASRIWRKILGGKTS